VKKKNDMILVPKYSSSFQKRVFDLLVGTSLLLCAMPAIVLTGTVIVIASGWPVFYSQPRLGKNKQVFTLYKFRTMKIGADSRQKQFSKLNIAPAPMFKLKKDPRFTSIGYYLSHTGLDELPQIFNVLKNDMSLVGPRPLPIAEGKALKDDWNWRWQVKPGLFSYWVLSPHRYQSLEKWKQLEKETIQISNLQADCILMVKILSRQVKSLVDYFPSIFQ